MLTTDLEEMGQLPIGIIQAPYVDRKLSPDRHSRPSAYMPATGAECGGDAAGKVTFRWLDSGISLPVGSGELKDQ
jgi:hypothetical protein